MSPMNQSRRESPPCTAVEAWLVVLRANGVVEAVEGGAPVTWLGRTLEDAPGTSGSLRRAAAELVRAPPNESVRRRTVRCEDGEGVIDVELLLVEALLLRRAHTHIHELVMRTLDIFLSQAKSSSIDLTIDQGKNVPPTALLDGEKVAWALATLVANALRYARTHIGVHVRWDDDASELLFEVSDDGPGMPEHRRRWLFERDPTSGHAAGLALLMVGDVMAAHRGSVSVRSLVGHGTTFTLKLPRVPPR